MFELLLDAPRSIRSVATAGERPDKEAFRLVEPIKKLAFDASRRTASSRSIRPLIAPGADHNPSLTDEFVAHHWRVGTLSCACPVGKAFHGVRKPDHDWREQRGFKQNGHATCAGIAVARVSWIEAGTRESTAETLRNPATALEVELDQIR